MAKSRNKGAGKDWKLFSLRLSRTQHEYLEQHQLSKADVIRIALNQYMKKNNP